MEDIPLQREAFEYFGALAFVVIGLVAYGILVTRRYFAALERIEGMHASRLEGERELARIGEAMRDTMAANTMALLANTEIVKASLSQRGRDSG